MLGAEDGRAHVRDGLHDHARDVQVRGVGARFFQEAVHVDLLQAGYVSERDGSAEQGEGGSAPGWS